MRTIQPRLATDTIREPPVRATDGNIHDEVERLVERSCVLAVAALACIPPRITRALTVHSLNPRIRGLDGLGTVGNVRREVTTLEECLLEEGNVEHLVETGIDVDANEIGRPFESVGVEVFSKGRTTGGPPAIGLGDTVEPRERTPVERATDDVSASINEEVVSTRNTRYTRRYNVLSFIIDAIPTTLHDIDFATQRPRTVRVVDGQHP